MPGGLHPTDSARLNSAARQRCAPPAAAVGRSRTRLCLLAVTRPCRDSPFVGFGKSHCLRRNSPLRRSPPASKGISFRAGEHDRAEKPPSRCPQQASSPSPPLFDMESPKPRQGAVPPLPQDGGEASSVAVRPGWTFVTWSSDGLHRRRVGRARLAHEDKERPLPAQALASPLESRAWAPGLWWVEPRNARWPASGLAA